MRPLLVLSARFVVVAILVILGLGAVGGSIRLLPWLVAPDVPLGLATPFIQRLGRAAIEVAVLVGVPVGVTSAAARFVERGESRALFALGSSPARLLAPVLGLGAIFAAAYAAASVGVQTEAPGRLAARLVDEGRAGCDARTGARVEVPLVGVTWLCFPRGARLVGRVPGVPREAWFSAAKVTPSADLRELGVEDLRVATRFGTRVVGLHAATARIGGLSAWGAPEGVSPPARAFAVAVAAWLVGLFGAFRVLWRGIAAPVAAAGVAVVAAGAMLAALRYLDAHGTHFGGYVAVPAAGALAAVLGFAVLGPVRRVARPRAR